MHKHFKVACLCSVLIFTLNVHADTDSVDSCHKQFQPLTALKIQTIFSDKSNYEKYNEQEGYLLFAQKSPNIESMEELFELVSETLGRRFKRLNWEKYQGSPEEMRKTRDQILDETGEPKAEYLDMDGYIGYAEDYHEGNMDKAFQEILAVLGWTVIRQKLRWKIYYGFYEQIQTEGEQILDEEGTLKAKYIGMNGYGKYAGDYHEGDMYKAYKNILSILEPETFKELGWRLYLGEPEQMQKEGEQILDEYGKPKKEYTGMDGYIKYTEDYYKGRIKKVGSTDYYEEDMRRAFINVSAILGQTVVDKKLKWKSFSNTTEQMKKGRSQILNNDGSPKSEYLDMEGYIKYAEDYHEGDMGEAYKSVLLILDQVVIKQLDWRSYQGSSEQYKRERKWMLSDNDYLNTEYFNMDGYSRYAEDYHEGDMSQAYHSAFSMHGREVIKQLGWRPYQGTSEQYQGEKERILDTDGTPKAEYKGIDGFERYVTAYYYKESSGKVYDNVRAVLGPDIFADLSWRLYKGSSEDLQRERNQILDEEGKIKAEYIGMKGYSKYAINYYNGNLRITYDNVLAVLTSVEFENLGWYLFLGTPEHMKNEQTRIQDEYHFPRSEYMGMEGYIQYATDYYKGNMFDAFQNVLAVIGGYSGMESLGLNWERFNGTVSEYQNLLELFEQNDMREFTGCEGLREVAEEIFEEDKERAYRNVHKFSKIFLGSRRAFWDLNWSEACF